MNWKTSPRKLFQTQDGDSSGEWREVKAMRGGQRGWEGRQRERGCFCNSSAGPGQGGIPPVHSAGRGGRALRRPSSSPLPVVGKPGAEGTTRSPGAVSFGNTSRGLQTRGRCRATCSVAQGTSFEWARAPPLSTSRIARGFSWCPFHPVMKRAVP